MTIDWEYFFPDVHFNFESLTTRNFYSIKSDDFKKIQTENGYWCPQKDFEFHLHKLKVDPKYFDEKNIGLFPKDFSKPLYSIQRFEEARVELLNRIRIIDGEGIVGYDEDNFEELQTFKIILEGIDKVVEVDKGTIGCSENKYHIRTKRNLISCHRFNAIYILYDWLLSLYPVGGYKNNWQIFAYGISEYNDTFSYVDTFLHNVDFPIPGVLNLNLDINSDKTYPRTKTAFDVREYLKEWNPFIEDNGVNILQEITQKMIDDGYSGKGTQIWTTGVEYTGEYLDGKRHGQGTMNFASGNKYEGEWKSDERNGEGTFTFADGRMFVGEFKGDKMHGQGTFTWANGDKYVGKFKDSKMHGLGTFTWANGHEYVGDHKDGKKHGQGIFTYADGTIKKGLWENDEFLEE